MKFENWRLKEQPRHKLLRAGPAGLSDGELLAILLGAGPAGSNALILARQLLNHTGGLSQVVTASATDLGRIHGMGPAGLQR